MEAARVHLGHDVKEERVRVVVECLVVEEEFGQQAQVLCVRLVLAAVDLEEADGLLAVDFVARRVAQVTLDQMPFQALAALAVL